MTPSVSTSTPADRRAVVEHRHLVTGVRGRPRTAPPRARRPRGSLNRVNPSVGQPLTEPGSAARRRERGATLVRRPGARAPGQVDQEVGDRGRRQHGVVTPRRQIDGAACPVQPTGQGGIDRGDVHADEVRCRQPGPRRALQVGGLRVHLEQSGGLHPAQPQPGGGPQVGGGHLVPGESVQDPVAGPGGVERRSPANRAARRRRRKRSTPAGSSKSTVGAGGGHRSAAARPAPGPTRGRRFRRPLRCLHHLGHRSRRVRRRRRGGDGAGRAADERHHEPGQRSGRGRWW